MVAFSWSIEVKTVFKWLFGVNRAQLVLAALFGRVFGF